MCKNICACVCVCVCVRERERERERERDSRTDKMGKLLPFLQTDCMDQLVEIKAGYTKLPGSRLNRVTHTHF